MSRVLLVCLVFATSLWAQSGQINLGVKDPSGAAAHATGTLDRLSAGVTQSFETDDQGHHTFPSLPVGRYRLEVVAQGFSKQAVLVDVDGDQPENISITLEVGSEATRVDVISAAPLPGVELLLDQIAAPVQTATQEDLQRTNSISLSDVLTQRLNSVYLNEVNGNPFQPDLNYRGFTASPVLGTPQGISIYMDGVRMNQPFGDVVSWDLLPRVAISETALIPGSDPLFGLNTLGGALSIRTKDGYTNPGTSLQIGGGSYGRRIADLEHGGSRGHWNYYGATSFFFEDNWRQASPSNIRQFMGKLGWQGAKTMLSTSVIYANNQMNGSGFQEQRFLARDYTSLYTKPDVFGNRSPFLNVTGRHAFNDQWTFFGNAYYRYISTSSFNADINENSLDQSVYQPSAADRAALAAAGYSGFPTSGATAANTPFPFWRCIAQGLQGDEPGEKCNGLLNRGRSKQHNAGFSGQISWVTTPGANRNQFMAGAAWDRSAVHFDSLTQLGYLNPDRTVTPIAAFADGVTGGTVDGEPLDTRVNLNGLIRTGSVYATNTLAIGKAWNITVSGRFNRTTIQNRDQLRPVAGPGSLTGDHEFHRFNPAVGVTYNPAPLLNLYARYSESNRAPTSIELGCADPNTPCKLPNAMAGDPPLKQVVSRTVEAGYRGQIEGIARFSAGWFRAENRDDIMFVSSPQTGFGYFKNFGSTRRQGLELDLDTDIKRVNLGLNYTFLDATFQSVEDVNGSANSTNAAALTGLKGVESYIVINPGSRIPLAPRHMGKAFADVQFTKKFTATLTMLMFSSPYARGNENNQHKADGAYYLGPGKSPGYAVFNLGGRYQLHKRLQLFAQMNNVFDRHYYTAAQLGPTGFTDQGTFIARALPANADGSFPVRQSTFFAPGAPRLVWGGVKISF